MERLTQRLRTGEVLMAPEYEEKYTTEEWICMLQDRLAAYEDTGLKPSAVVMDHEAAEELRRLCRNYDLGRLEELAEADKDGRVVVLPCKVGDTIFHIDKVRTSHFEDDKIIIDDEGRWKIYEMPFALVHLPYIGRSYFLTREDAEAALEAMDHA